MKVFIYWGVKDLNTDELGPWDATELGKVSMDENLDLSTVEAQ